MSATTALRILVVDDEPDLEPLMRQKFRRRVRTGEYELLFARDGVGALELLSQDPRIELVLTDLNMPHMDGLTLLARLAELERSPKAVVVTAYGDMENIRTAMNRGAFDFLTKPLDLSDLEITIEKARDLIEQHRRAALVRTTFGRDMSDEVVTTLLDDPSALRLGGEKRQVTILMSDLRGFSQISERFPPETVVELLNVYLGRMTDIIGEHKGTIGDFLGDGMLVTFGAPIQREDDALRAVACAVEMQRAMVEVNERLGERDLPPLQMGVGINSGEVVVGNIGSERRASYGVVGSHVNLAARIESYTVGGQVLISESTLSEAGSAVEVGREMKLSAKGFAAPINLYEVRSVGGPYNLRLPDPEHDLKPLRFPWPFRFVVLDGKHMTGEERTGEIVGLSTSGAEIRVRKHLTLLTNVQLILASPQNLTESLGDLYAKVVEEVEPGLVKLRFTAVPEEVAEAVRQVSSARQ